MHHSSDENGCDDKKNDSIDKDHSEQLEDGDCGGCERVRAGGSAPPLLPSLIFKRAARSSSSQLVNKLDDAAGACLDAACVARPRHCAARGRI